MCFLFIHIYRCVCLDSNEFVEYYFIIMSRMYSHIHHVFGIPIVYSLFQYSDRKKYLTGANTKCTRTKQV